MTRGRSAVIRSTFAALAVAVLGWTTFVASRPDSEMLSYLNDDAFYYLLPAYSFAHGEGWSFDHLTRTSGFHFLYGYLSALVSLIAGYTRAFPIAMAYCSAAALLVGLWLALRRTSHLYGSGIAASGVALTLATPRAFLQMTTGLEWGLAIMATALVIVSLAYPRSPAVWTGGAAIAAFIAVLTRLDLAIFAAIYAAAIAWSRWVENEMTLKSSILLLMSAGVGVCAALAVIAVNSWMITGRLIPNSVAMKEFWSRTNSFQPAISWNTIVSCTGPGAILTSVREALHMRSAFVMALFTVVTGLVCWGEWQKGADRRALAIGSAASILAYTIAYAHGVNLIADHYSAPIVIPVMLLTCGLLATSGRNRGLVTTVLAVGIAIVAANGTWRGNAAHFVIARHAGELLAAVPQGRRVAAWNAGIAGWRAGGHLTNLDGLANAAVVDAIQVGSLACFLSAQRIDYLMDFGYMFPGQVDTQFSGDEEARRQLHIERNGYDSAAMYRCVSVEATANDDAVPNTRYRLFKVDSTCLRALCRNH